MVGLCVRIVRYSDYKERKLPWHGHISISEKSDDFHFSTALLLSTHTIHIAHSLALPHNNSVANLNLWIFGWHCSDTNSRQFAVMAYMISSSSYVTTRRLGIDCWAERYWLFCYASPWQIKHSTRPSCKRAPIIRICNNILVIIVVQVIPLFRTICALCVLCVNRSHYHSVAMGRRSGPEDRNEHGSLYGSKYAIHNRWEKDRRGELDGLFVCLCTQIFNSPSSK